MGFSVALKAQQNVGIGTVSPDSSAILEMSSSHQGVLVPRMPEADRQGISHPANGLVVFDTTHGAFYFYDRDKWQEILSEKYTLESGLLANDSCYTAYGSGPGNDSGTPDYPEESVAWQSITMTGDGFLDYVIGATVDFDGGYVHIYEGEGTDGALLHSQVVPMADDVVEVTFPFQQIFFSAGEMYTIAIEDTVDLFQWIAGMGNPYSGGMSGSDPDDDRWFYTNFWLCTSNYIIDPPGAGGNTNLRKINAIHFASGATFNGTQLNDVDGDTKIQMEESPDEDFIRFDLKGKEYFRMERGRIITSNFSQNISIGATTTLGSVTSGEDNIGLSRSALRSVTSGSRNLGIGAVAGVFLTTGEDNICMGVHSGYSIGSGSRNVLIGSNAGSSIVNRSGNICIGYEAGRHFSADNRLYIENSDSSDPLIYGEFDNDLIRINNQLGVNRTPVTNTLEVGGDASKNSAGDWLANSDARLKSNMKPLSGEDILQKMLKLRGITYEWADDKTGSERPEGVQYGFTAQNIQEVFPELVEEDNLGYLQTAYGTYDAMYVECIRALVEKIRAQEELLSGQNKLISELQANQAGMQADLSRVKEQIATLLNNSLLKLNDL